MTKRQKGLCDNLGCHEKEAVIIKVLDSNMENHVCGMHFVAYVGYMNVWFSKQSFTKDKLFDGINLAYDS